MTDLETNCHCYDPRDLTKKLFLCGSELCKAVTTKAYRNGKLNGELILISEDDEEN